MILFFVICWCDELLEIYIVFFFTFLNNVRLIWYNIELVNMLSILLLLFKNGVGVWGGEVLLFGMLLLVQVYSGYQFGVWVG